MEKKALRDVLEYGPRVDEVLEKGNENEKAKLEYEMKISLLQLEHALANSLRAKSYVGKAEGMSKCFESSNGPDTLEDEDRNDCSKAQCSVDPNLFSCEGKYEFNSDMFDPKLEEPMDVELDDINLDISLAFFDGPY